MPYQIPGAQRITAGSAIGASGKPKRVFFVSMACNASTAGTLTLYDAASAASTANIFVTLIGQAGSGNIFDLGGEGIRFPNGCFAECSANSGIAFAVIVYQEEK